MMKKVDEIVGVIINEIQDISNGIAKSTGVQSGFNKLDELTAGWQPGELSIIAARPGMGVLAFVCSMVKNMAIKNGLPVAIYTLDISSCQLIKKMIAAETGISIEKLRIGKLEPHEWEMLHVKSRNLVKAPIFVSNAPYHSMLTLCINIVEQVLKENLKIIIIDYLQLLPTLKLDENEKTDEKKLTVVLKLLKSLAKELEIPIILISKLLPTVELREGNKRPFLFEIPMYERIEKEIDVISFLYRPEYYGFTTWDNYKAPSCEGEAELIIFKRNEELGTLRLKFNGVLMSFSDIN